MCAGALGALTGASALGGGAALGSAAAGSILSSFADPVIAAHSIATATSSSQMQGVATAMAKSYADSM
jgi:hypothetical protein